MNIIFLRIYLLLLINSNEEWERHFESLFNEGVDTGEVINDEHIFEDVQLDDVQAQIFNGEITDDEILKAVKSLKLGKSAGLDGLVPEMFVYGIEYILPLINRFFNRLFSTGDFPESWGKSILVPLHKKGSLDSPDNYRRIALQSIFSKLYTSILNRRLTFYANMYDKISENQAGFREGYSTIANAFILNAFVDKYLSKQGNKLYVAFVDFRKAFDSINRGKLWQVLRNTGVAHMHRTSTSYSSFGSYRTPASLVNYTLRFKVHTTRCYPAYVPMVLSQTFSSAQMVSNRAVC